MNFFNAVKKGKVSAPVYRSYSNETWETSYAEARDSIDCDRIYTAGRIVFRILDGLRKANDSIPKWCESEKHIKLLVGICNRDSIVLSQALRSSFKGAKDPFMNDLEHFKVELTSGQKAKPDEIGSSIVDSLSTVIPDVWSSKDAKLTKELSPLEKLTCLSAELNLCNTYQWIESIWRDCLWNGYEFVDDGSSGFYIQPGPGAWAEIDKSTTTSLYRKDMFQTNQVGLLANIWSRRLPEAVKHAVTSIQFVTEVVGQGKTKTFRLSSAKLDDAADEALFEAFFAKELIQKDFYAEILSTPVAKLEGDSVERLFDVWLVLRSLSRASATRIPDSPVVTPNTLAGFACSYPRKVLIDLVSRAAQMPRERAAHFLEFLTFRKNGHTLWTQPLVEVDSDRVLLPFSALHQAQPLYVLECWLPMLQLDLGAKGNPFEREVRKTLKNADRSQAIRDIFSVFGEDLTFFPNRRGERNEEIDLIFLVGGTLFIGEIKCSIVPIEDIDFYNNREILNGAVEQAIRKAACVERNLDAFSKQLKKRGFEVPSNVTVKPLVVTNNLINSGYPIKSVPVADLALLTRYLEGSLIELSYNAGLEPLKTMSFYCSPEEAEAKLDAYLADPPQLRHMKLGLQLRELKVPANFFDVTLPELTLRTYEVEIDVDEVKERLGFVDQVKGRGPSKLSSAPMSETEG